MKYGLSGSTASPPFSTASAPFADTQVSEQAEKLFHGHPNSSLSDIFDSSRLREAQLAASSPHSEATTLARLLTSLTLSSTLEEALARFYAFLPEPELRLRTSVVLARTYEILPQDVALKLIRIGDLSASLLKSTDDERSRSASLVLFGLMFASALVFTLTGIGAFTAYGYVVAHFHPLTAGTMPNRILRYFFFMVCTCSEHSK